MIGVCLAKLSLLVAARKSVFHCISPLVLRSVAERLVTPLVVLSALHGSSGAVASVSLENPRLEAVLRMPAPSRLRGCRPVLPGSKTKRRSKSVVAEISRGELRERDIFAGFDRLWIASSSGTP